MVDNTQEIMVSICCLAYNQEKYIRNALDGFLKQKTDFRFEILVHDDASTDKTAEIIREYEKKYPDIIYPIYQNKNQYSMGKRIIYEFLFPRVRGKYIALCEADDFWIDEKKLQIQYNCLENNASCAFCIHKVQGIDVKDETRLTQTFPDLSFKDKILAGDELIHYQVGEMKWLFQLSSFFFRSEFILKEIQNIPLFMLKFPAGDLSLQLYYAMKGNFYYIDRVMSKYRMNNPDSWCGRHTSIQNQGFIEGMEAYNKYTEYLFDKDIEKYIGKMKFDLAIAKKEYKELLKDEYKDQFASLGKKQKICYTIFAKYPFLRRIYDLYKNKIRG